MKRLSLAIMFVFCTLTMAAQDGIQVLYEGAQPNIYDFACAFIYQDDGDAEDCDREATAGIAEALERYRQNENQNDNVGTRPTRNTSCLPSAIGPTLMTFPIRDSTTHSCSCATPTPRRRWNFVHLQVSR